MAESNRNRHGNKSQENVSRTGSMPENRGNKKLPDNFDNDEFTSTKGDTFNPKYSKTSVRKEDKERWENSDKSR